MADQLWGQGNTTAYNRIFKAQFGSVFARDANGAQTALASDFSPFTSDGLAIDFARLASLGFVNLGSCSENGVKFNPKFTTSEVKVWQTRMPVRSDVESDQDAATIEFMEATSAVDAIFNDTALTGRPADGSVGYNITQSGVSPLFGRQYVIIGVDMQNGVEEYSGVTYARALKDKKTGQDWNPKNPVMSPVDITSFIDPYSGWARQFSRGGPGWINSGGTTGAVGTPVAAAVSGAKATLTFAPPSTGSGSYTYSVQETTGGNTTAVSSSNVTVSSTSGSSVVLTVSGLTAGTAYTFTVTATSTTNGSSATSPASNSITATA